uniref:Uncharacterized protein n=1 Tax=Arundo donax TaxID=35708 RepID=A0A0A9H120_ARUDO
MFVAYCSATSQGSIITLITRLQCPSSTCTIQLCFSIIPFPSPIHRLFSIHLGYSVSGERM